MSRAFLDIPDAVAPDYQGGSLLNLSVSFATGIGRAPGRRFAAAPCTCLPDLSGSRIVVFLLIDGLGANDVKRRGPGAFMDDHAQGQLTSVFPPTTASAVTASMSALAPAAHGLTGWYIRDPRFGGILAPLPMVRRDRQPLTGWWPVPRLFPYACLFQHLRCRSAVVSPEHILGSPFNMRHTRGAAARYPYRTLNEMVAAIGEAARNLGRRGGFVYAYHPDYDALAHAHGIGSDECTQHYGLLDDALQAIRRALAGLEATLVVSADHGFIDSPPEQQVCLEDHPALAACLDGPLWGEWRSAYCRVLPQWKDDFENVFRAELGERFELVGARRLIDSGAFGPAAKVHPRLAERVGDYAIIGRGRWTLHDRLPGERAHTMVGVHAGVSADEMFIPLVVAHC